MHDPDPYDRELMIAEKYEPLVLLFGVASFVVLWFGGGKPLWDQMDTPKHLRKLPLYTDGHFWLIGLGFLGLFAFLALWECIEAGRRKQRIRSKQSAK